MARIKKRGLDYFPLGVDFLNNRIMTRMMMQGGDATVGVLLNTLIYIHDEEGYFVKADRLFYEDVMCDLFLKERGVERVKHIIDMALDYGFFDKGMFEQYGILTSADIQAQYLYCTQRRVESVILPQYKLVSDVPPVSQEEENQPAKRSKQSSTKRKSKNQSATETPITATEMPQSRAQEKDSTINEKENIPPLSPTTGEVAAREEERVLLPMAADENVPASIDMKSTSRAKDYTQADIDAITPPDDDVRRNFQGLLDNLRQFKIAPAEQYAIISLSNYGMIGHRVWKVLSDVRCLGSKIKMPGRFILSEMRKR